MKKFAHWVFDLDGTLIDSTFAFDESITLILNDAKIPVTSENLALAYNYFDPAEYFALFFSNKEMIDLAVKKLVHWNQVYASKIPCFPGIESVLKLLHSKRVHLSVWTGRDLASAQEILKHTGLSAYIDRCVGGTCVSKNKPFPDGLLKILEESKHPGEDVLMVGDHEYDMRGAQAAGVKCVSAGWDRRANPKARQLSNHHFDSIEGLLAWAQKVYQQ